MALRFSSARRSSIVENIINSAACWRLSSVFCSSLVHASIDEAYFYLSPISFSNLFSGAFLMALDLSSLGMAVEGFELATEGLVLT